MGDRRGETKTGVRWQTWRKRYEKKCSRSAGRRRRSEEGVIFQILRQVLMIDVRFCCNQITLLLKCFLIGME